MNEEEQREGQELRNQIAFGMDVDSWMEGPMGRYLIARATEEADELKKELVEFDIASDVAGATRLQQEIVARRIWQDWLRQAIQQGLAAQALAHERGSVD